jgi:hypothetical protein
MSDKVQYTIRNIPKGVDEALRKLAVREGCSLNSVALSALEAESGINSNQNARYYDLDELAGTWVQDDAFDRVMDAFDVVDEELWQ